MCFSNPFHGWPFGSFGSESRKSRLHDLIEDVSFEEVEEVKESTKEPVINEHSRAAQIAAAALKETEALMHESPLSGLLVASLFVAGAKWSDDNPATKFGSKAERTSAMAKEIEQMEEQAEPSSHRDLMFSMILFRVFSIGATWAESHPAPMK